MPDRWKLHIRMFYITYEELTHSIALKIVSSEWSEFYITYEELTFNAFAYDKSSIIFTDGFSRFTLPMRN